MKFMFYQSAFRKCKKIQSWLPVITKSSPTITNYDVFNKKIFFRWNEHGVSRFSYFLNNFSHFRALLGDWMLFNMEFMEFTWQWILLNGNFAWHTLVKINFKWATTFSFSFFAVFTLFLLCRGLWLSFSIWKWKESENFGCLLWKIVMKFFWPVFEKNA